MSIWNKPFLIKDLQHQIKNTLAETIGIELTEITDDSLKCRMEVNNKTKQSMGILHGGASAALAETLGSIASNMIVDKDKYFCVGLDINASHLRPVKSGYIYAEAKPIHLGKKTHVWRIDIVNDMGKLVCTSRLTMAILNVASKSLE
ncbi:MAG: PaaI family thioesterase [Bacteroidia bacterium]|nr:PaaI family thioesterase [Bacteroidia bacterium]